jgi:sugar (pentulose or hexulose) kinase
MLFKQGLAGDADGGGLLAYHYFSGEHITHLDEGRPLFIRTPESRSTGANFMRVHLFSALGALKIGMDYFNCTLNYRRIIWLPGRAVRSAPDHQSPPI